MGLILDWTERWMGDGIRFLFFWPLEKKSGGWGQDCTRFHSVKILAKN